MQVVQHAGVESGEGIGAVLDTRADDAQLGFDSLIDQLRQRLDGVCSDPAGQR